MHILKARHSVYLDGNELKAHPVLHACTGISFGDSKIMNATKNLDCRKWQ